MKPLRTGLGVGLLAGGVGAVAKIVQDRRAGTLGRAAAAPRVVTGSTVVVDGARASTVIPKALSKSLAKGISKVDAKADGGKVDGESPRARRAARRAAANRPPWVVAPAPGAGTVSRPAPSTRPAPTGPRKLPNLIPKNPVSAQSVAASVGKFAVKRAGKAIGKVAADRVGKAIEVIEVLEKVVASVSEPATSPDLTSTGPGATMPPPVAAAVIASVPARPGPAKDPSAGEDATPRGTLVSVRKFERGPRVVVGPTVRQDPPPAAEAEDASPAAEATEAPPAATTSVPDDVAISVEAVAAAVEASVEAAASAPTDAAPAPARAAKKRSSPAKAAAKAPSPKPRAKAAKAKPAAPAAKRKPAKRTEGGRPTTPGGEIS